MSGTLAKGLAALVVSLLTLGIFANSSSPVANFTVLPTGTPVVGQMIEFWDASTGNPVSWSWDFGDGQSSADQNTRHVYKDSGSFSVTLTVTNAGGSSQQVQSLTISPVDTLRLNSDHPFMVKLLGRNQRTGMTGPGQAIPQSDLFGYFSIPSLTSNADNPEVFVKIIDGTAVNGSFWVFYGGLTDLEYTLTVTELATERVKAYLKPAGSASGGFDTTGFESAPGSPTPTPVFVVSPTPSPRPSTPASSPTPTPTAAGLTPTASPTVGLSPTLTQSPTPTPTPTACGFGSAVGFSTSQGGNDFCGNGTATVTVVGGLPGTPPYSYSWYLNSRSNPLQTGPSATVPVTQSGLYCVDIVDALGCSATLNGTPCVPITVFSPTAILSGSTQICSGATATLRADLAGITSGIPGETPSWRLTWSDGFIQTVSASPALRSVSPTVTTTYGITSLVGLSSQNSGFSCPGTTSGVATITVITCGN